MRHFSIAATLLLLVSTSAIQAEPWTGHASVYIGQNEFDADGWGESKKEYEGDYSIDLEFFSDIFWDIYSDAWSEVSMGIRGDFKPVSWPVYISVGTTISGAARNAVAIFTDDDRQEITVYEYQLGIQKYFNEGHMFQPYIGGGINVADAEIRDIVNDREFDSDNDRAVGIGVGTGFVVELGSHFDLGLDVRYSEADLTLYGVENNIEGVNTSIRIGTHW